MSCRAKRRRAVDDAVARDGLVEQPFEHRRAAFERTVEGALFGLQGVADASGILPQLGIPRFQRCDDRRNESGEKSVGIAEQPPVANRAPNEKPQHVAAIGVRRIDAVVDEERHRARMIGDDVAAHALLGLRERRPDVRLGGHDVGEQVGIVHRRLAVADREHALEAGAGIDRLAREFGERAVGGAVVLLEDDVPELDEARTLVGAVVAGAVGVLLAEIVEEFRARTTRAGRAHRPEVVVVEARDARGVQADLAGPDAGRFVVAGMHGDVEPRRIEPKDGRGKLPRHGDRFAFVIVVETEVAEHLEKRPVTSGAADVFDVALGTGDAQAALHRDRARRRCRLLAEEHGDELLHAGDRKERRRHFVRNEARRRAAVCGLAR